MSDVLKVKPAPGRAVRDPKTMKMLAADGETKPRNGFWLRRLAGGDVIELGAEPQDAGEDTEVVTEDIQPAAVDEKKTTRTNKGAK